MAPTAEIDRHVDAHRAHLAEQHAAARLLLSGPQVPRNGGVLRSHMRRANRALRDSVLFSILAPEWPAVRARLEERRARR